jgi:hypothetical protein
VWEVEEIDNDIENKEVRERERERGDNMTVHM